MHMRTHMHMRMTIGTTLDQRDIDASSAQINVDGAASPAPALSIVEGLVHVHLPYLESGFLAHNVARFFFF